MEVKTELKNISLVVLHEMHFFLREELVRE